VLHAPDPSIAEADLAWMRKWGYLAPDCSPRVIDTMRMQRRLNDRDGGMPHVEAQLAVGHPIGTHASLRPHWRPTATRRR